MVLDTRFLHGVPEAASTVAPQGKAAPPLDAAGKAADPESWGELLERAVAATQVGEHARVINQLRRTLPSDRGIDVLWSILADVTDRRRRLAALVLGYHRDWLARRSRVRSMVAMAHRERDVQVARAMVWSLRRQDEVVEFLGHQDARVARESALGLVLNAGSVTQVLKHLLAGDGPDREVGRILLQRLRDLHPSLVRVAVDHLASMDAPLPEERLGAVLACFPPLQLFQALIERRRRPEWDPQRQDGARRVRRWQQLATVARGVMEAGPDLELTRYLLTRSSEDDVFARRHAVFLRTAVQRLEADSGSGLLTQFERLSERASEAKVARLAELLVELRRRLQGRSQKRAESLLDAWKNRSSELRLRIYQLENELED